MLIRCLLFILLISCNNQELEKNNNHRLNKGFPSILNKIKQDNTVYFIVRKPKEMTLRNITFNRSSLFGHVQMAWSCFIDNKKFESGIGLNSNLIDRLENKTDKNTGLTALLSNDHDYIIEDSSKIKLEYGEFDVFMYSNIDCKSIINNIEKVLNEKIVFSYGRKDNTLNCTSFITKILENTSLSYLGDNIYDKLYVPSVYINKPLSLDEIVNYKKQKLDFKIEYASPSKFLNNLKKDLDNNN